MALPLGPEVPLTPNPTSPSRLTLLGAHVTPVPLSRSHEPDLHLALNQASQHDLWTYIPTGPFPDRESFRAHIQEKAGSEDPLFWAVIPSKVGEGEGEVKGRVEGYVALMRIDEVNRVLEIGHVFYGQSLQRTRASTETIYLRLRYAFETVHYRRVEWKCDNLNEASKRAALRLGFTHEGVFRQHMAVKGRNRDSAWFSMLDGEWEGRKKALEGWLGDGNFDEMERQRRLEDFREVRELGR